MLKINTQEYNRITDNNLTGLFYVIENKDEKYFKYSLVDAKGDQIDLISEELKDQITIQYNSDLLYKLKKLEDKIKKETFYSINVLEKKLIVTRPEYGDDGDLLIEKINNIIEDYSDLDIQYIKENNNFNSLLKIEEGVNFVLEKDLLDLVINKLKYLKTNKDYLVELKEELDGLDLELEDKENSDLQFVYPVDEPDDIDFSLQDKIEEIINDNKEDFIEYFSVTARGYCQGDYECYNFYIQGDKNRIEEFKKSITKPLESLFTFTSLNITEVEKQEITYYDANKNITYKTIEDEVEIDGYWYSIYGNETQKEIEEQLKTEDIYKNHTIIFKD